MGIFKAYRQERARHSVPESVATLDYMEDYLRGGENWTQGVYRQGDARCLVGAAEYARVSTIDDAKHWLRLAIAERTGGAIATIEEFNDRQSFVEIAAVVDRAKQLAAANLPAPVEVIPPARLASPWRAPEPHEGADHEPVSHERPKRDPDDSLRHRLMDALFD